MPELIPDDDGVREMRPVFFDKGEPLSTSSDRYDFRPHPVEVGDIEQDPAALAAAAADSLGGDDDAPKDSAVTVPVVSSTSSTPPVTPSQDAPAQTASVEKEPSPDESEVPSPASSEAVAPSSPGKTPQLARTKTPPSSS